MSVVLASLLSTMPVVSSNGWWPDFGYLALIAWRLLRSEPFPAWWAAPLGLVNDLVTGSPIGFSVTIWTASMLVLDVLDRRIIFRDYWVEWGLAAVLLLITESAEWRIAAAMGADVPYVRIAPPVLIAVFCFPITAWLVARIDRWRLGR
jgi:rod shape-determining protein MreD